ncbi:MAG TPA: hypothetical protein VK978_01840 [Candidatus Saccharimonadales bacterium]|nr:hypothetical protein [Candidatus Saccharimonadales bacterium]
MQKNVATLYVFDLDGVITDPGNSQVNEAVIDKMFGMLASGTVIAINTGRSYDWVNKQLIARLAARGHRDILSRLLVVCEKGGETVTWNNSQACIQPSSFALSPQAYEITKTVFERNKIRFKTMSWDTTKRTMATIEKRSAAQLADFHAEQGILKGLLTKELSGYDVRIDATTVATDVESTAAGKYAGAEVIWERFDNNGLDTPTAVISIGDSISDYEMARCFATKNIKSTFVYVGEHPDDLVQDPAVDLVLTIQQFSAGTLEYLLQ